MWVVPASLDCQLNFRSNNIDFEAVLCNSIPPRVCTFKESNCRQLQATARWSNNTAIFERTSLDNSTVSFVKNKRLPFNHRRITFHLFTQRWPFNFKFVASWSVQGVCIHKLPLCWTGFWHRKATWKKQILVSMQVQESSLVTYTSLSFSFFFSFIYCSQFEMNNKTVMRDTNKYTE